MLSSTAIKNPDRLKNIAVRRKQMCFLILTLGEGARQKDVSKILQSIFLKKYPLNYESFLFQK
jgi:hypothetical protein